MGGSNNGRGKWRSMTAMLENKVRNKKRQLLVLSTSSKPDSCNEESDDSDNKYGNRMQSTLTHQGKSKQPKNA